MANPPPTPHGRPLAALTGELAARLVVDVPSAQHHHRGGPFAGVGSGLSVGAVLLRSTLHASDLPDPAAPLVGRPKPVVLKHR
jgi:hypothetical protein